MTFVFGGIWHRRAAAEISLRAVFPRPAKSFDFVMQANLSAAFSKCVTFFKPVSRAGCRVAGKSELTSSRRPKQVKPIAFRFPSLTISSSLWAYQPLFRMTARRAQMPDQRAQGRSSSRVIASEQRSYAQKKIGLDPARPVVRSPRSRRPEVRCRAEKVPRPEGRLRAKPRRDDNSRVAA